MNDDHILLASSNKIHPFNFLPDTDIQEGMDLLRDLIQENMVCEKKQRRLILCWLLSWFIPDFAPYQALMKFSGYASSGKSTAGEAADDADLTSNDQLSDPTGAARLFRRRAQNPVLVIDNLEHRDLSRSMQEVPAAGGQRAARRRNGRPGRTRGRWMRVRALWCALRAIEPFNSA